MRAAALAFAVLLVLSALALAPSTGARAIDFGAISNVNKLINVTATPQLAPGESGEFDFKVDVTYSEPITNVTLLSQVYEYATIDGTIPVDANWAYPYPLLQKTGGPAARSVTWNWSSLAANSVTNLSFTVLTVADGNQMPQGSVFSQATYFLRFALDFDGLVGNVTEHFHMASSGFFTQAQWAAATSANATTPCYLPWCRGIPGHGVNVSMLGVDGILPDSSFGVLVPIPRWPFYLLIAVAVLCLVFAFLFWVEENPGNYPRVEAWWARQRGRMARMRPARRPKGPPKE